MHFDCSKLTNSVWILVGIYWIYTSIGVKPVVRREHSTSRAWHLLIMLIACFLLFSSQTSFGPLAIRLVSEASWICWTGLVLTAAGCSFAVWARALLGRNWSAAVTLKEDHELVRGGPYAIVRHPIYTGLLTAVLGTALEVGEMRALIALIVAFFGFLQKARREEKFLLDRFNGAYVQYSRSVKRLIPFLL